ncbi:uncharacterized protein [Acropora muricata]|uniref:uncharacterized protein isoform X1 n=1 Tax=Acropora muricata TaxID=159855 RepID=UPI0034E5045B
METVTPLSGKQRSYGNSTEPSGGVSVTPLFDVPAIPASTSLSRGTFVQSVQTPAGSKDRDAVIKEYLDETGVIDVIETWMKHFADKAELQYNPYPGLVWEARQYTERFHMFAENSKTIVEKIETQVFSVGGHACRTEDSPARWGLATVLRAVNTESLMIFDWLLSNISSDAPLNESEDYSYNVQKPIPVIVGPCAFAGSLYPLSEAESINIRMEYSISGPEEDHAVEIFSKAVLHDILLTRDNELHIVLGVIVHVEDVHQGGRWVKEFWTCSDIESREDNFLALIKSATLAQKIAESQCMFRLLPESRMYRRGFKQYSLNFISTNERRAISVSSLPYLSAHEGVFVSSVHIKEYLSWFSATSETAAQQALTTPAESTRGRRSRKNRDSFNSQQRSMQTRNGTSRLSGQSARKGSQHETSLSWSGPYSDEVLDAVRTYMKDRLFDLKESCDFMRMLHYVILLLLLDRNKTEDQSACLVEAYRLLHSNAYQLHLVIQQNLVVQDLVTFSLSCEIGASDIVQNHFLAYRYYLKEFFTGSFEEKRSELQYHGLVLLKVLDSMTIVNPHLEGETRTGTLPLTSEVISGLKVVNRYCQTIFLGLLDDALSQCSHLLKYLVPLENSSSFIVQTLFQHGAETADIVNQRNLVLDVETQAKRTAAPSEITKETVLSQYFVDTKLDQVFHEFLIDVVTDEFMPPNPYPKLASQLAVAATRMELFGEKRAKLLSKLIPGSVQLNLGGFLFYSPGVEAYGLVSAMATLDGKQYNNLRSKIHSLSNKVNQRLTVSGFKALVDTALCGFTPLFGRFMPYLLEVDLGEHYFIQGPRHARSEAIGHFVRLVYDHLVDVGEKEDVFFLGMFLGGDSSRRILHDIVAPQRKKAMLTQMISTITTKQPLYIKAYVKLDWRLVMVTKSFLFHFIQPENGYERFYNASDEPLAIYQSVFTREDVALLFLKFCGPLANSDPCRGENLALSLVHVDHYIERAKEEDNLLAAYRWLMVKSLMSKHQSYLVEAWYMLHSVVSELEYVCSLNRTLQRLINEELSRTFRPVKEDDERTSLLDVTILNTMVTAYCDKLERVLSRGTAFAPSRLLAHLQGKLRLVTYTDAATQTTSLRISSDVPVVLQEINEMLQPLLDAASQNVHLACPEIHRALKSVEVDVSNRRSSIQAQS